MIKIKSTCGFEIRYQPDARRFFLLNKDFEEIGSGETQDEMEAIAKKLSKEKFNPVLAFKSIGLELRPCTITSLNAQEGSFWHTDNETKRRGKENFRYSHGFWEQTKLNIATAKQLTTLAIEIQALEKTAIELMEKLEAPINRAFFGLSES